MMVKRLLLSVKPTPTIAASPSCLARSQRSAGAPCWRIAGPPKWLMLIVFAEIRRDCAAPLQWEGCWTQLPRLVSAKVYHGKVLPVKGCLADYATSLRISEG